MDNITFSITPNFSESHLPEWNTLNASSRFRMRRTIGEIMLSRLLHIDIIIGLLLSISTMIANSVSLIAINYRRKSPSTNMRLVTCLSSADLINGLSVFLHIVHIILAPLMQPNYLNRDPKGTLLLACTMTIIFCLYATSILVSLLTLTTMALDHYLAILKPLHHHTRFRKRNCNLLILSLWLLSVIGGFSNILSGLSRLQYMPETVNFCEFIQMSEYNIEYVVWAVAILCMIIISYTYGAICYKVYEINRTNTSYIQRGYNRNRKAMMTTLIIVGSFLVCWLPTCLFQIVLIYKVDTDPQYVRKYVRVFKRVNKYLVYLLLLNSLFDPIVYAIRLREIKECYRRLFGRCCWNLNNCYRLWGQNSSSNLSSEANSYVYYRQRPVDILSANKAVINSSSGTKGNLINNFQAPLRVTFSKHKSSSYNHSHPVDEHMIPCMVKVYSNKTSPKQAERKSYLYMKCNTSKHNPDESVNVRLIPTNSQDRDLLASVLLNNNTAVCKYRQHIANTYKGRTRFELDKIHIYCDPEDAVVRFDDKKIIETAL